MRYAILDKDNIVVELVESESPPADAVKAHDPSAEVGRVWTGWIFEEQS